MLHDPFRLFYSMFSRGWQGRGLEDPGCLGDTEAERQTFFNRTWNGDDCNQNFYQGTHDWPNYAVPSAPALLGFGNTIMEYCLRVLGEWHHVWWASSPAIADACIRAGTNVLRLKSGWTMCLNLKWQICAVKGLLHGQNGQGRIHFAPAPNTLRLDGKPSPARQGGRGVGIIEEDVFYLEICVFAHVCENGADIFTLEEGALFDCQLSEARFRELAYLLSP